MTLVKGARTRLDDVARRAGVSRATASKAVNGRADVSPGTRARVLAAAQELGYEPAAGEQKGDYPLIALVADNLTSTYTLDILRGAATAAMSQGVALVSLYTPPSRTRHQAVPLEDAWFDMVKAQDYVGVIVVTSRLTSRQLAKVRELGIALVAIDPANAIPPDFTSIGATNWNGGVEATQHLVDLGHRRIGFVRGTAGSVPATERLQGYLSALSMNELPHDPRLVAGDAFTHEGGLRAGRELLSLPEDIRPSAIFASCDDAALGVFESARQLGLSVPGDVSVVGFDDTLIAGLATPGLTTVRQPLEDMGSAAVRSLMDRHAGRPTTTGPIRLATNLVLRGSTREL
ncbi:LacI family DNA-binding transcriptional regulator [Tessaracoccus sp. OS52]|uniref:LacI family DNA-binding transcriptional regulator n=1 Tax=Tessaracoccus sp. OS52 TaxID=2886691 RepID=UPI001D104AFB|nr:LacI family DNA-binding transcriptional regulator [Tessaracoccus sp. OS52]